MAQATTNRPVLILGSNPRITLPIARSLHRAGIPVEVASFVPAEPELSSRAVREFHRLPVYEPANITFAENLCSLIQKKQFDMLIPATDEALDAIAQNHVRLRSLLYPGCPPPRVVERVGSRASASKGTDSKGIGVGVGVLMHDGRPVATFQQRRLKDSGRIPVLAESEIPNHHLVDPSVELLRAIEWEGPAMVEYRLDPETGSCPMTQVTGRFWDSLSLAISCGFDFPLYAWQLAHGIAPDVPRSYQPGVRWRWTAGYLSRLNDTLFGERADTGTTRSRWNEIADLPKDMSPAVHDALWSASDASPALHDLSGALKTCARADLKQLARWVAPRSLVQDRSIYQRLGPKAGPIYSRLRVLDSMRVALDNRRTVPANAKSFLFVCHGNLMRSPMAERMMQRASVEHGHDGIEVRSAGMHALAGREAHPRSQVVARELGLPLDHHRAQLVTRQLVDQSDAIFAMDFQNKAELLAEYPDAAHKIFMMSAYAEGGQRYRQIADPYFGDLDEVRRCYAILQTCIHNLVRDLWPVERVSPQHAGAIR